jgi:YidC/Oxa1 family membrane protein insertase
MDRKSIIVIVFSAALLGLWFLVVPKLAPPRPAPPVVAAHAPVSTNAPAPLEAASGARPVPVPVAGVAAPLVVNSNVPEELVTVTNADVRYVFTSYGGGLKLVELVRFPEAVSSRREKADTNRVATLNGQSPAPAMAVLGDVPQGDRIFRLTRTATGVRAEKALTNGLLWVKEFTVDSNYLMTATVRLENRSAATLTLPSQEWVVGMAAPMNAEDLGQAAGVMWFNGDKATEIGAMNYFSSHGFACTPRVPPTEYVGGSNVVWTAAHNQYFTTVAVPKEAATQIVIRRIELPRPSGEDARLVSSSGPPPQGYETTLVYPGETLAPSNTFERQFTFFTGPKEYKTLAVVAARLNNNVDTVMGFDTIPPFYRLGGFFARALLLAMNGVHSLARIPYGWAIIAITVILKAIFWPMTAATMRSSKRMARLQPQMNAIKEKYKDDPLKAQQKVMAFMKENKVNPMGGCLPAVIQMPVFIGFFTMIRTAIELRGASFLWISDLSRPDTLFVIPNLGFVPFIGVPGVGLPFNLLPILMGATMLWQSHSAPMSPGVDPAQQKMMRYMPLIFLVFLYNYSAGMALYWTANNLLTILQSKLTRAENPAPVAAPALTPPQKKKK